LIDVIGMGASSRPGDYPYKTIDAADSVQYFNSYFEKWRIQMGNLTDFYVLAHSLGGYLMGQYALNHTQHIKKLVFISPIGMTERGPDYNVNERWHDIFDEGTDNLPPMARQLFRWSFENKVSLFAGMRMLNRKVCASIVSKYIDPYMQNYTQMERDRAINYLL